MFGIKKSGIFTFSSIILLCSIIYCYIKSKLTNSDLFASKCASFTLIMGNLTDAKLIILGENHSYNFKTRDCIDELAKSLGSRHTIYEEGLQAGFSPHNFQSSTHQPRLTVGWDDMSAYHKLDGLMKSLEQTIKDCRTSSPAFYCERNLWYKYYQIQQLHLKRNKALISTLQNKPVNRVGFVIAGLAHVMPISNNLITGKFSDVGAAEYTQSELKKLSNDNPYAILAMK